MSSLIVLCPHCLTWIEIHADCCTECGCAVSVDNPDPCADVLASRLGERLIDIGPMKLLRRGWPDSGRMLATTQGLLFLPQFAVEANGALVAVTSETSAPAPRVSHLFHWWSIPPWRRPVEDAVSPNLESTPVPLVPVVELLFNVPGTFFIRRDSIQRITVRWGRAQIERPPSRSVSLAQTIHGPNPRDALRLLIEFSPWREIVAGL